LFRWTQEDSRRRIKDRALKILDVVLSRARVQGHHVLATWDEGVRAIEAWLDLNPECRVVIIDVLAKFKDMNGADSKSAYDSDYSTIEPLQKIATQRDVAIIVIHHSRKAETDDIVDVASGTLGTTAAADHLIVLRNDKLEVVGRDLPGKSVDLVFDRGRWEVIGESAPKGKVLDKVERIERDAMIRKLHGDGVPEREIAKKVGCAKTTVHRIIDQIDQ
jgi:hypothetical protein